MTVLGWICVLFALMAPRETFAQEHALGMNEAYAAAFYSSGGFGLNEAKLVVFPLDGEASTIALPFPLGRFAYSLDGTALYTETAPAPETRWRLVKINLDPIGKTWIPPT
jgi:hypothetical protein